MLNSYKYKRWTPASRECYKRGCICNNTCSNYFICVNFIKKRIKPPIKQAVLALVKRIGSPFITKNQVMEKINNA